MSSWNQQTQPNNNMVMGQAQFAPYWGVAQYPQTGNYTTSTTGRLPVYQAPLLHGQNAAWQFQMGPNSEIYLPDADEDIIWWIRTDNTGNKSVKQLNVVFPEEPKPIDMNDVLTRLSALEEKVNAKQNKSNAKRGTTANAVSPAIAQFDE